MTVNMIMTIIIICHCPSLLGHIHHPSDSLSSSSASVTWSYSKCHLCVKGQERWNKWNRMRHDKCDIVDCDFCCSWWSPYNPRGLVAVQKTQTWGSVGWASVRPPVGSYQETRLVISTTNLSGNRNNRELQNFGIYSKIRLSSIPKMTTLANTSIRQSVSLSVTREIFQ